MADYVRYRPRYPRELLDWLSDTIGFARAWRVADIGSGTGIFAQLLLENGNEVQAVEPNNGMREEAEASLAVFPNFHSVNATAEATTLGDHSVDLVTAAQAFHWFDPAATKREFHRILKPGGWVLIVFNTRVVDANAFSLAYEELLRTRAVDYTRVDHRLVDAGRLGAFFGEYREWHHRWIKRHDRDGVVGLSGSSSYTPAAGHPGHHEFYAALRELFAAHAHDGHVEFLYETEAYLGRVS
ncbi:MAG TPA: class I SAM-dependent methyltransferase [Candidatus Krumholzibacteria bacterium]|nr:class I SAM-dependent methyltransferase [Candidatus Krumholzibacteria bacterium]